MSNSIEDGKMDEESASEADFLLPKHPTASKRRIRSDSPFYSRSQIARHHQFSQGTLSPNPSRSNASDSQSNIQASKIQPNGSNRSDDSDHSEPLTHQEIYTLLGMLAPSASNTVPKHLESAHGLYSHLLSHERRIHRQYTLYDITIVSLMIFQLCISAVFVVLGSLPNLDQHHVAVAALGALGTVVAGVLALMKGQGLPNRLRMERDALRRVILEAEELYWDGRAGRKVTFEDVVRVREAYAAVVEDARKNHPDVWTSSPVQVKTRSSAGGGKTQIPGAAALAKL